MPLLTSANYVQSPRQVFSVTLGNAASRITNVKHRRTLAKVAVSLRFLVPPLMLKFPLFGAWSNHLLDSVDGDVLLELGMREETYQTIDKAADFFSYVNMLILGRRWRIRHVIVLLFLYRSIGQALFFTTRKELVFLYFPNFLEPLVMTYTLLLAFSKGQESRAYATYRQHRGLIWSAIIVLKVWNEWVLHVANIDLSERLLGFTGGGIEHPDGISHRPSRATMPIKSAPDKRLIR
jgi:hypothetical protein